METTVSSFAALVLLLSSAFLSHHLNRFFDLERQKTDEYGPLKILKQFPIRQIDEMCSETTFYCFTITDKFENTTGRPLAFRGLRQKGADGVLLLSDARLLIPRPMTYRNLDTRKWELDKTTVRLRYARTMISGIFFSHAVEYNSLRVNNVLIFGLGGGVINNYLSSMPGQKLNITIVDIDPVMKKIAEKWYGFKETDMHRIIVEDGVEFIKKASDIDLKYDAILLDLCTNERKPLLCPIEPFLKDDAISNLSYNLAETGVVIVNIITPKDFTEEAIRVLKRFEEHFPFCVLLPSGSYDRMLFCFKRNDPWGKDPELLHDQVLRMDRALGFHLKDGGNYQASDKD
ncbi:hypothetical protein Y032_0095g2850 [Ancylostoma ceylanicum]|uniref:PABS domain-containing protein n=2 Tax=Ancylostoma ceylanicum TaxID=53326 RepID=A0A016TKN6_9BILA|nr:hypothetical protein Y032_0095g2850 [Ancylostoma ceylanicum]